MHKTRGFCENWNPSCVAVEREERAVEYEYMHSRVRGTIKDLIPTPTKLRYERSLPPILRVSDSIFLYTSCAFDSRIKEILIWQVLSCYSRYCMQRSWSESNQCGFYLVIPKVSRRSQYNQFEIADCLFIFSGSGERIPLKYSFILESVDCYKIYRSVMEMTYALMITRTGIVFLKRVVTIEICVYIREKKVREQ